MPAEYEIRRAIPEDAADLAAVHVRCWQETYRGLIPDDEIDRRTIEVRTGHALRWLSDPDVASAVAVDAAGDLFGFATARPWPPGTTVLPEAPEEAGFDYVLNGLYVLASAQRRGAGRALLRDVAARRLAAGGRSMLLWVLAENRKARAFYEAAGAEFVRADPAQPWNQVIYGWRDLATSVPGIRDRSLDS